MGDVSVGVGGAAAILAPELRGHGPQDQSPPLDLITDGQTGQAGGQKGRQTHALKHTPTNTDTLMKVQLYQSMFFFWSPAEILKNN